MFEENSGLIADFDPHFKVFHDLMGFKVQEILLVSSLYDAYIMEEDGNLATRLINEYHGLNLSKPPKITRASSAGEALRLVRQRCFDMVLTMPYLGGMNGFVLGKMIKEIQPELPVILLAHNMRATFPDRVESDGVDQVFMWCCEADLLLALIKNVEDHRNVERDTRKAMVRVLIYVEDSPFYRSIILPMIYSEVVRQTQSVLDESLNERHRLLRMRARPKILLATNYEEALALYRRYQPYVFGVISDARYRRDGKIEAEAGLDLLRLIRDEITDLPLLLVSTEQKNRQLAARIPAVFVDKNSPSIRDEMHAFFLKHLGFGDFIFRLPDETAIGSAANLHEFEKQLRVIPESSLRYHTVRNHFSNWVMARAEVVLARRLHKDFAVEGFDLANIREELVSKVHALRRQRQQGLVIRFNSDNYDPEIMDFVRIGRGSMGGKARGIAFMWACLHAAVSKNSVLADYPVSIPKTCVLTADGFDAFIEENNLGYCRRMPDQQVADLFLDASLPFWLRSELRAFLHRCDTPISVRSSSLLEDGQFKPYAGLYATYFLPNNHPDFDERFAQLESAVKLVYASTWFEGPIAFSRVSGTGRNDSMAVIIQELAGAQYGDYWYPAVSGVAQSHNYYPVMGMRPDEGIAHIAVGVGKTVVEGERALWFSPRRPKKLVQFSSVENTLRYSQQRFYAVDMRPSNCLQRQTSNLVARRVEEAEDELPVRLLSSTYLPDEHRIRDGQQPGPKVMTFAGLLKYSKYPFAEILSELLTLGKSGMGGEVEIEFALHIDKDIDSAKFYLLQIRPMITGGELAEVQINNLEVEYCFGYFNQCLGHGNFSTMRDIVYVCPEKFNPAKTREIAAEIGRINRKLQEEHRSYLLVGPGRWGSSDPWLGIPVQWADISGVAAIIEVRNRSLRADASQGTHFFQNITSLGIPYLTLDEEDGGRTDGRRTNFLDWQWLKEASQQNGEIGTASDKASEDGLVCHVRVERPFMLKCDGARSESGESVLLSAEAIRKIREMDEDGTGAGAGTTL